MVFVIQIKNDSEIKLLELLELTEQLSILLKVNLE